MLLKLYLLILFSGLTFTGIAQNQTITGKVTANGEALEGATIIVTGTHLGVTTSKTGDYRILIAPIGDHRNSIAPKDTGEVLVSLVGYKSRRIRLVIADPVTVLNIELEKDISELNQVVVTGVSRAMLMRENPLAMKQVSSGQIDQAAESNVIDAIAQHAPGFQAVKTGPNVSKPFINGLGYNRVLTLYDGMRVETQQWGDEHGVPMDDYIIERAEIIKGPASLLYGSDAIAGVLSLIPALPHETDNRLHGRFLSEYQANNGLIGNSLSLFHANAHWSWALRGSERVARNYTDPVDGRVYNTGFKMTNVSGFLGYTGQKGYSRLNVTYYDNRQGIPDGSRDSFTRKFTFQIYESAGENTLQSLVDNIKDRPIVADPILNSYSLSPLSQRIQDYRLYTDHFYRIGDGDIKASLGVEQNIRREFNHPTAPARAGEYIVLNTVNYGWRYNAPAFLNIEPSVGANGMYQANTNKNATDFPIPAYRLFDLGVYAYGKWKHNKWTIAGGVRYDHRTEQGDEMYIKPNPVTGFYRQVALSDSSGGIRQFSVFRLHFQGVSGSIGFTYQVNDRISMKANIARGYRSPNYHGNCLQRAGPGSAYRLPGKPSFYS